MTNSDITHILFSHCFGLDNNHNIAEDYIHVHLLFDSLRKHAYSNIFKISPPKTENFQIKKSDIFLISAQNIDCGYSLEPPERGGSNECPQSMF